MAARVFIEPAEVVGSSVRIAGDAARHLAGSRRARPGEVIVAVEDARTEHGVQLREVARDVVVGDIIWSRPATGEPSLRVHILQAVTQRGMDEAVAAMSQLGAASIHPVVTHRTVPRLDGDAALRRAARWNAIAREAAQLADRACAPEVNLPAALDETLAHLPTNAGIVLAALQADRPLAGFRPSTAELVLCIGPEGGFDELELQMLRRAGAVERHLGARVLPARLAGTVALVLALAGAGDLDAALTPAPTT